MRKILPILLLLSFVVSFLFVFKTPSYAQTTDGQNFTEGQFYQNDEVTFVGKTASRSAQFLDWTLQNYQWLCVAKNPDNQYVCNNAQDPLIPFWIIIRNIVYALMALFVLATAFILIITRGQNVTIMRFVPRFIFIIILVTLSFSLVQFLYQVADIIQDFFLKSNGTYITTKDLLFMGFNYQDFTGYRVYGGQYDESAFITLLLVRLTAITYYVMTGILIVRKIILWFFIIISPVFPLLLFYKPIRNTAKIWIGEFFRWLLYAPLFAIFLHGLVVVWKAGIPLPFDKSNIGEVVYPTAVNILLGGPGQSIYYNSPTNSNSVNLSDTFALYVVALLMLWVVIILPFILLKIFLDFLGTISFGNNIALKQFVNKNLGFLSPGGIPPTPQTPPPAGVAPAGAARTLPFLQHKAATIQTPTTARADVSESSSVLRLTNLSIPKMRDIAQYETSMMSKNSTVRNQAIEQRSSLSKIANPSIITAPAEREKFTTVRQQLLSQKQQGNVVASQVLAASQAASKQAETVSSSLLAVSQIVPGTSKQEQMNKLSQSLAKIANPASAPTVQERDKFTKMKEELEKQKAAGDKLAASVLEASGAPEGQKEVAEAGLLDSLLAQEQKDKQAAPAAGGPTQQLPTVNKVQQVSLDDYEEVRKLWTENYQTLEPPKDLSGEEVDRREWIKNDIDKINSAISLLSAPSPEQVNQGMNMVANILPFLLIGGFSKTEVIAYLKAKMEAGKQVLVGMQKKEEDESTMISTTKKETAAEGHLTRTVDEPEKPNPVFGEETPKKEDPNGGKL